MTEQGQATQRHDRERSPGTILARQQDEIAQLRAQLVRAAAASSSPATLALQDSPLELVPVGAPMQMPPPSEEHRECVLKEAAAAIIQQGLKVADATVRVSVESETLRQEVAAARHEMTGARNAMAETTVAATQQCLNLQNAEARAATQHQQEVGAVHAERAQLQLSVAGARSAEARAAARLREEAGSVHVERAQLQTDAQQARSAENTFASRLHQTAGTVHSEHAQLAKKASEERANLLRQAENQRRAMEAELK